MEAFGQREFLIGSSVADTFVGQNSAPPSQRIFTKPCVLKTCVMRGLVHDINHCLIIYLRRAYGTTGAEQDAMRRDLVKWEDAKDLMEKIAMPRRGQ